MGASLLHASCRRSESPTRAAPTPTPAHNAGEPIPSSPSGATPSPSSPIERRTVPGTDEELPIVGLGTWQAFDIGDDPDERAQRREVLRRFFAHSGAVIDSSPMYGRAESVVGELVEDLDAGEQAFMATKVWTRGRGDGIEQMKASMHRMHADPMDLMQVHNLVDVDVHLRTLAAWKAEGRVRYVGITHWRTDAFDELAALMQSREIDFVQLPYSIALRDAEKRLLPLARDRKIGVIVNRPFEGGDLFGAVDGVALPGWAFEVGCRTWAQLFLKFILSEPAVTCVIPATSKPKHLDDNMAAGHPPFLSGRQRDDLQQIVSG